jgi:hypothetical protein
VEQVTKTSSEQPQKSHLEEILEELIAEGAPKDSKVIANLRQQIVDSKKPQQSAEELYITGSFNRKK